jgi:PPOX class probable F420-dependent enzyme
VDAEIANLPRGRNTLSPMKLNDTARQLLGSNPATLVTINRDGSSQVSVVWIVVQRTADGDDELVTAHLADYLKLRNIRRDPRVSVTVVSTGRSGPFTPWLSVKGTARVEEGGAPELLEKLITPMFGPATGFPPRDAPPGYLTRITIEKVGGVGPWAA